MKQKIKTIKSKLVAFEKKNGNWLKYLGLVALTINLFIHRAELNRAKIEIEKVKAHNLYLVSNMIIFNRNYEEFPLSIWQKVKRKNIFIMQYVNPKYVEDFGHQFDYNQYALIGKTNYDIFSGPLANQYHSNDMYVALTGQTLEVKEYATDSLGNQVELDVIKWRDIKDKKDTLVYGLVKNLKVLQ